MFGCALAVSTLRDHSVGFTRRDLACPLWSARQDSHSQAQRRFYRSVAWFGVGRVWKINHTEPPTPIDGRYRCLLTVRDLARDSALAALSVEHPDASSTIAPQRDLFARHGAPLV